MTGPWQDWQKAGGDSEEFRRLMDQRWDRVRTAYKSGQMGLVAARIEMGTASWRERWAYRYPRLLGWLDRDAVEERLTGVHPHTREALASQDAIAQAMRDRIAEIKREQGRGA